MRKEVIFAITAGVVLGIIIAFGIWRANTALRPKLENQFKPKQEENNAHPKSLELSLVKPENNDVITESPIQISGITKPQSWIIISAEDEDYVIKSDPSGNFEENVELVGGVNQIIVKVFDDGGNNATDNLLVAYSTEFNQDESSKNSD